MLFIPTSFVQASKASILNHKRYFHLTSMFGFLLLSHEGLLYATSQAETKPTHSFCQSHNLATLIESKDETNIKIHSITQNLAHAIETQNLETMLSIWHPRIRPTKFRLQKLLTTLHYGLGKPVDVTSLRIWEISSDNSKESLAEGIPCSYDGVTYYPLYGYTKQIGLLFQAMGNNELGRITVILVPKGSSFQIGFMHFSRWTHQGNGPEWWLQEARKAEQQNNLLLAYLMNTATTKLTRTSPHLSYQSHLQANTYAASLLAPKELLHQIQESFKGETIMHVDSILVSKGLGLSLRFQILKEWSSSQVRRHCLDNYNRMQELTWTQGQLHAIKCSYTIAGEEPEDREGRLGSLIIHQDQVEELIKDWGVSPPLKN
ncbi:MAG: hypothetical protein OXT67_02740 [Zetaproteobacteria bacterium]|nr:hypothetical protein [Zetaproteobacteria bacterium]